MIELHTYSTINGQVAELVLHCLEVEHRMIHVDLMKGAQRTPGFLKLNPSGRIPVLVDHAVTNGQGEPLVVSQTGAIVTYLGRQYGGDWYPDEEPMRSQVDEWIWFQLTDISTNLFNNFYLKSLISEPQPQAADELRDRALGFYQVFDQSLRHQPYLTGEQISLADLVAFPVVRACTRYGILDVHPDLYRWFDAVAGHQLVSVWLDQQA